MGAGFLCSPRRMEKIWLTKLTSVRVSCIHSSVSVSRTSMSHMWGMNTVFWKDENVIKLRRRGSARSLHHNYEEQRCAHVVAFFDFCARCGLIIAVGAAFAQIIVRKFLFNKPWCQRLWWSEETLLLCTIRTGSKVFFVDESLCSCFSVCLTQRLNEHCVHT